MNCPAAARSLAGEVVTKILPKHVFELIAQVLCQPFPVDNMDF